MDEKEPNQAPVPSADLVPAPKVASQNSDQGKVSGARIFFNGLSVLLAALTLAPIGIGYLRYFQRLDDSFIPLFWMVFLPVAAYAACTRHALRGKVLTLVVCGAALLNLGGCLQVFKDLH